VKAAILFAATSIVAAMLISGWRAGSLDNRVEWIFWAGAVLGAAGIGCLGLAAERDAARLATVGMSLFLIAPALCVIAVFADNWI
jgi:hypothetical protein